MQTLLKLRRKEIFEKGQIVEVETRVMTDLARIEIEAEKTAVTEVAAIAAEMTEMEIVTALISGTGTEIAMIEDVTVLAMIVNVEVEATGTGTMVLLMTKPIAVVQILKTDPEARIPAIARDKMTRVSLPKRRIGYGASVQRTWFFSQSLKQVKIWELKFWSFDRNTLKGAQQKTRKNRSKASMQMMVLMRTAMGATEKRDRNVQSLKGKGEIELIRTKVVLKIFPGCIWMQ